MTNSLLNCNQRPLNAPIEPLIVDVRGRKVILAADLATLYGVETRVLNQQIRRNEQKFPDDFCFQLTRAEFVSLQAERQASAAGHAALTSQNVTLKRGQHAKYLPLAFTEHRAIMAATVLNSPKAVAMSVYVVRTFVQMREQVAANNAILKRLAEIDKTLLAHDHALMTIWNQLEPLLNPPAETPKRRIGFKPDSE